MVCIPFCFLKPFPQAFLYHILECNPQHITHILLKEYLLVVPFMAVDAEATKLASGKSRDRLPWAELLCMPLTCLIRAPTSDEAAEFEQKMGKRCGGDFNRNLAVASFVTPKPMSKSDVHCSCRCMLDHKLQSTSTSKPNTSKHNNLKTQTPKYKPKP